MFTGYQIIMMAFGSLSILVSMINTTISLANLRANRKVAAHAQALRQSVKENNESKQ